MVLRWLPLEAGVDKESCRVGTSGVVLSGAAAGGRCGAMRGVLGVLELCDAHSAIKICSAAGVDNLLE